MADSSTANSKLELRQKLENMKKAYAQTLRKVQKSEKAKRTRSHVQRVIAEQSHVISNDASPSCTHRLSRRICGDGDVATRLEKLSSSETGTASEERVINVAVNKDEGSKSTMATKRMQRKRRSVSFSIPKENAAMRTPIVDARVGDTDSHLGSSEVQDQQQSKKMAAEISQNEHVVRASSSSVLSDGTARDMSRLDEKVTLVVPESQFTEPLDESFNERNCTPATSPQDLPVPGRVQGNVIPSANGSLNSSQSVSHLQKSASLALDEMRPSQQSHPANVQSLSGDNSKTKDEQKRFPNPCQSSTKVRTRRANGNSRRRSRVPRELTAADISFKEVVESQSTEEGSHTWIEGMMYPAEYYVRRTRSMTSSQCLQSQSNFNGADSQRYLDSDPRMRARGKGSSTEKSGSLKDSLSQGTATLPSGVNSLTEASESVSRTDSDSMKSQLSQSLLKAYPGQSAQECTDKNVSGSVKPTKTSRNQRRQRKCGATSALWTDTKAKSSIQTDSVVKSVGEFPAGQWLLTVANVKLPHTEFALPEEDYGALKLVKLQSGSALDISSCTSDYKGQLEGITDHLVESQSTCLVPEAKDVGRTDHQVVIQQRKSDSESCSALPLAKALNCLETMEAPIHFSSPGSMDSGKDEETVASKMTALSKEALQSGMSQCKEIATSRNANRAKDGSSAIRFKNVGSEIVGRQTAKPQGRSVLESQLSPTQNKGDSGMAFLDPGCTPGWSPTCSPGVGHEATGPGDLPLSSRDKTGSPRCQNEDELKVLVSKENVNIKPKSASIDDVSKCNNSPLSGPRNSGSHLPNTSPPQSSKVNNQCSSRGEVRQSLSASPTLLGPSCQDDTSKSTSRLQTVRRNPAAEPSTVDVNAVDGNVTPPNAIQRIPVDPRGNIKQISPFAGVATGTPPGRAEEPMSMSQCVVQISGEEDDEMSDESGRGSRHELALAGCLQHDLPWEALPTVRDVTGGWMHMNGQDVSLLAVLHQHTLVIWWTSSDTQEWQILKSWILPEEEGLLCVMFMPCSRPNMVSLVVAGVFATCGVRMLNYDTVTEEMQQMDVNLSHSCESPVQYLLCVTDEEEFAVAVKDDTESALFLVNACIKSRNVQTVELWTGKETNLTSLLKVEGANGMLMATTAHNDLMLWNCKTGELIKDVPMKSVDGRSRASCLKAVAESGLLFLVMIFHDDVGEQEVHCSQPIGATIVFNPLTDKLATLVEYQPSTEHTHASLADAVIHKHSLLAKLSDGSLHQWDIFSGNLMNYSSLQPANHSLRSAHLCRSEVVLLGTDQCQQVYDAY